MAARSTALLADPEAPRIARRFTAEVLREHGCRTDTVEIAELLVSELVTNVVRHTHGPGRCSIVVDPHDGVVVEVADAETAPPQLRQAAPEDLNGRGMALVEALTEGWGVRPILDPLHRPIGKVVWFRLACQDTPSS